MSFENKLERLKENLKRLNRVAVAFSSGVDSTFLLKVSHDVLGENVLALTAKSCVFPKRELDEAVDFCNKEGIKHIIIEADELQIEGFRQNPPERCYLCKKELFKKFIETANSYEIEHVIEGSNIDDTGDYRPGMRAVRELGIKSPLMDAGLSKDEIRILSKEFNLQTWQKPSFACLASRFVYGEEITEEKLKMVEKSEQFLFDEGFCQVRVRVHECIARIEVLPEDFEKLLKMRGLVVEKFKNYGFSYVTMDLAGYRTGSMNEVLKHK